MKRGDLVRHKRLDKLALIFKSDVALGDTAIDKVYQVPEFIWLDTREIDSCTRDHLEVVNGTIEGYINNETR